MSVAAEYPLSYGQRALWFVHRLAPHSAAYNIVAAARVPAAVDQVSVRWAMQALVDRHPALRTTFAVRDGEPVQRVHSEAEVCFIREDAAHWSDERLYETIRADCRAPFNLESGPVMRVTLYSRSATEHALVAVMHHIVTDFWSLARFAHELSALYSHHRKGEPCPLRPPRAQYADYVREQAEMLGGPEGERLWNFWRAELAGELPALDLPLDRPRPAVQTFDGAVRSFSVPRGLSARLKSAGADCGAPLWAVCLAAFQALLARYSGQDEFLMGFPRANRTRRYSDVLGYFVNPLALRADLRGNPPFRDYLRRVHEKTEEALAHGEFPFPLLVEKLRLAQDPSRSPLWQVAFTWQKTTRAAGRDMARFAINSAGGGTGSDLLPMESLNLDTGAAPFDLTLQTGEVPLEDGGFELAGALTYNTDLFEEATIARMTEHLLALLEGVAEAPQQRVRDLPLMTAGDARLLAESAAPSRAPSGFEPVQRMFERQAREKPDRQAVVSHDGILTYGELDRRANRMARTLRALGVGPEVLAGFCLERSPEAIVALLGILKAGGAFLPLDPAYPSDRLAFTAGDAAVRVIVTQRTLASRFEGGEPRVFCVDADWDAPADAELGPSPVSLAPDNLAYVIYTSGSTGLPKGVAIPHGEFAAHCRTVIGRYELTGADRILQFASFNFDAGLEQIFPGLAVGATLYLRGDEMWTAAEFHRRVMEDELTVINTPPAYWQQWVEAWTRRRDFAAPDRLRLVIVGGDALPEDAVAKWNRLPAAGSGVRLLNAYGPTETTITATLYEVGEERRARIPIGFPLAGRQAYVLDGAGRPLPVGVPGELCLGGVGVARGYLNRPEITAEKFVPSQFAGEPGARLYRTGDLARFLSDGSIEYLGRLDQQVKIRGFRVELGEVEAALRRRPEVEAAAVTVRETGAGDRSLCAYVVCPRWEAGMAVRLRNWLKTKLPEYMIPRVFVRLEALPLGPGGKVDRRALPPPGEDALCADRPFTAPRTAFEEALAAIFRELLGTPRIGVYDDFFELGGHSLLATQVISRVRDAFQVEVPLRDFFDDPTVAGLSVAIAETLIAQTSILDAAEVFSELGLCGQERVA